MKSIWSLLEIINVFAYGFVSWNTQWWGIWDLVKKRNNKMKQQYNWVMLFTHLCSFREEQNDCGTACNAHFLISVHCTWSICIARGKVFLPTLVTFYARLQKCEWKPGVSAAQLSRFKLLALVCSIMSGEKLFVRCTSSKLQTPVSLRWQ